MARGLMSTHDERKQDSCIRLGFLWTRWPVQGRCLSTRSIIQIRKSGRDAYVGPELVGRLADTGPLSVGVGGNHGIDCELGPSSKPTSLRPVTQNVVLTAVTSHF